MNLLIELQHLEVSVEVGDQGIEILGLGKDVILVHDPLQGLSLLQPLSGPSRMGICRWMSPNCSLNFGPGLTLLPLDEFTNYPQ